MSSFLPCEWRSHLCLGTSRARNKRRVKLRRLSKQEVQRHVTRCSGNGRPSLASFLLEAKWRPLRNFHQIRCYTHATSLTRGSDGQILRPLSVGPSGVGSALKEINDAILFGAPGEGNVSMSPPIRRGLGTISQRERQNLSFLKRH